MAKQAKDPVPSIAMELVDTQLGKVPFSKIRIDSESYAFRDDGDFSPEALKALAEDIAANGLTTPLLVKALPDGTFLLLDGHRRYFAIKLLIEQGVAGFTAETPVPAHVIVSDASELTVVAKAVSANAQRQPYSDQGRIRAAVRLKRLGMPEAQIARLLGVSESTVARDLELGMDEEMMGHVRSHHLTSTTAAALMNAAARVGRLPEFKLEFQKWVDRVQQQVDAEELARAERDEGSLMLVEKWPQRYLTGEQVRAWKEAMAAGTPLGEPTFRFKAMLRDDKGLKRIEIDGVSKSIGELSAADLAKILQRCVDLAEDLKPVLLAKKAEEEQVAKQPLEGTRKSPGREMLEGLGLGYLASAPEAVPADGGPPVSDHEPEPVAQVFPPVSSDPTIPQPTAALLNRLAGRLDTE